MISLTVKRETPIARANCSWVSLLGAKTFSRKNRPGVTGSVPEKRSKGFAVNSDEGDMSFEIVECFQQFHSGLHTEFVPRVAAFVQTVKV